MNEEFLKAIRAEPEATDIRLVYADWLEDQGDPRGAFIRAQCQLETLQPGDPARIALEVECNALLDAHRTAWSRVLPGGYVASRFRRGFIESIALPETAFTADPAGYKNAEPLRHVDLYFPFSSLPRDPFDPSLLEGLAGTRWFGQYSDADLHRLLDSPPSSLTSLGLLARQPRPHEPDLLIRSPLAARLEGLALAPANGTADATRRLLGTGALDRLKKLSLHNVYHPEDTAAFLAAAASLPSLQTLVLHNCLYPGGGAGPLLASGGWENFTALRLRCTGPTPGVFKDLARACSLQHLHTLQVSGAGIDSHRARLFARSRCLRGLAILSLADCRLDDESALTILRSPRLAGLRSLDLSGNRYMTPDAVKVLARAPALSGLVRLNLRGVHVGEEGAVALARSPHLSNLRELDLQGCRIGPRGTAALARSGFLSQLRRLNLARNHVGRKGATALAASPHLHQLISLTLHGNAIDDVGAIALAGSNRLWSLRSLDLRNNWVREGGMCKIMELLELKRLHRLRVAGNGIGKHCGRRLHAMQTSHQTQARQE